MIPGQFYGTRKLALFSFVFAVSFLVLPQPTAARGDAAQGPVREMIEQRRAEKQRANADMDKPGDYVRSLEHDGLTRTYRIHIPARYQASRAAPLVIAFHGGGGDMDYMAKDNYYGLISKSEAEGFIVVFPNGYSKFRSGKFATWNAGACCANARDQQVDDVGFVRKLVARVTRELNINRSKIFATGMSNGGMMSYRLACEMSDTFAAIAAVAGTDNTLDCQPRQPVSILHIHARNDDRVLFNGGAGKKFRDESKVTDFVSVDATIAKWVALNKCPAQPERVLETPGAFCERYSTCRGKTEVQLCVTETGGHSWPGGKKPRADEPPSTAISATDMMWEFFNRR